MHPPPDSLLYPKDPLPDYFYPIGLTEEELVKIDSDPTIYILVDYKAHPITFAYWSNKLNYAPVTTITPAQLKELTIGGVYDYASLTGF